MANQTWSAICEGGSRSVRFSRAVGFGVGAPHSPCARVTWRKHGRERRNWTSDNLIKRPSGPRRAMPQQSPMVKRFTNPGGLTSLGAQIEVMPVQPAEHTQRQRQEEQIAVPAGQWRRDPLRSRWVKGLSKPSKPYLSHNLLYIYISHIYIYI